MYITGIRLLILYLTDPDPVGTDSDPLDPDPVILDTDSPAKEIRFRMPKWFY